jgi:hypothetical protein
MSLREALDNSVELFLGGAELFAKNRLSFCYFFGACPDLSIGSEAKKK